METKRPPFRQVFGESYGPAFVAMTDIAARLDAMGSPFGSYFRAAA